MRTSHIFTLLSPIHERFTTAMIGSAGSTYSRPQCRLDRTSLSFGLVRTQKH